MTILILGPPVMEYAGQQQQPARRMTARLLGLFALRANRPLSPEWLVDSLWGETPPPSAGANLRSHVADLRRLVDGTGAGAPRIEWSRAGYHLTCAPGDVDALRFRDLLAEGRRLQAADDHAAAAACLTRATQLWRAEVMLGVPLPLPLYADAAELAELRLDAVEAAMESRLHLGNQDALAATLRALVTEHPLRERLWHQLMRALYAGGRQAEALSSFRQLHRLLDRELGIAPSPPLVQLHQHILRQDLAPSFVPQYLRM